MHRLSSGLQDIAFIFSKDVDINFSGVDEANSQMSQLFLNAEPASIDADVNGSDAKAFNEEIKESMYVVKLLEMIDAVLSYESHLFSSSELELLNQIQVTNPMQQFLIARLVLRKRGKWHRADQLLTSYQDDFVRYLRIPEADVPKVLAETLVGLCTNWRTREKPPLTESDSKEIIDLTLDSDEDDDPAPKDHPLPNGTTTVASINAPDNERSNVCSFAEDTNSANPAELLECLTLDELKSMAKKLKVTKAKQTRPELIRALLHSSSTQTTLPFAVTTKPSARTLQKNKNDMRQFFARAPANRMPLQERRVRDLCYEIFSGCFRLREEMFRVLRLLSLVYFRSTTYTEDEPIMLSAILATTHKRNYPKYEYRRTADIFKLRVDLLRYMESLQLVYEIEVILSRGPEGIPPGAKFDRLQAARNVIERFELPLDRWNSLVAYFKDKPPCDRGRERFEEGHILTRIVCKAAYCYGVLKEYNMELKLRIALIRQGRWRRGKRGGWYDRVALIYTKYMDGGDVDLMKARDILLEGLGDKTVHLDAYTFLLGSRPQLLRRLRKLEKRLRVPSEEQHYGDEDLKVAPITVIERDRVPNPQQIARKGKSIWVGKYSEVSVEELALEHYASLGFEGFHSEGSIVSTLFGLLFWDILFAPIPGAFETPYQSAPLDLVHDSFVSAREDLVKARLGELTDDQDAARRIITAVDERERENETWCVGIRWDRFEREVLLEIVDCLGGTALATICQLLAEEYGNRRGGVPDLFVWNHDDKICKFVEVKGPGDNLSETQTVWIDVLLGAGVDVEVCRVYETGKVPSPRTKKNKSQDRVASKTLSSKAKGKCRDPNDGKKLDPEPEEDPWSTSEDGDGVTGHEQKYTQELQPAHSPNDQLLNELGCDADHKDPLDVDPEGAHPPNDPSVAISTSLLGKREAPVIELGSQEEFVQSPKRVKASKAPGTPKPERQNAPRLLSRSATPKTRARPRTPTSPVLQPSIDTQKIVKAEPQSPMVPSLADGVLEHRIGDSHSVPRSTRGLKQWREELVTPIKKERKGKHSTTTETPDVTTSSSVEKRKRTDPPLHTSAVPDTGSPSTSSALPTKPQKPEASPKQYSIARSRTPRKRIRTSNPRDGVAGSPSDWEKEFPYEFPKWVGDMADHASDEDYEPGVSQSQSQSQSQ